MSGLEKDTIGGFNSLIQKQRKEPGEAIVSTVLFDDNCEVLHDWVPMEKVQAMTEDTYFVRGCTALVDAVGSTIHHIGNIHKYVRYEDQPEKTIHHVRCCSAPLGASWKCRIDEDVRRCGSRN